MFFDTRVQFADAVASGNTGTNTVGNVVDLKATGVDGNVDDNTGGQPHIGNGQPVYVTILVSESYTGGVTADTIQFNVVTSDNANLTSATTLLSTASASLYASQPAAGDILLQAALPITTYKRYIGIQEVVVGTTTTGKVTAYLHIDPNKNVPYPQFNPNLS